MKLLLFILVVAIFSIKAFANDKMDLGLEVFNNKGMCGTCHTLKAARSDGEIGPNLDMLKPQMNQIIYTVINGIGLMPSWNGILTTEEIEAVAYYVFNSTKK